MLGCRNLLCTAALLGCRINFDEIPPTGDAPIGELCRSDLDCVRCARCEASVCTAEPINDLFLGHRSLCYTGANGSRWCAGENNAFDLGLGFNSPPLQTRPRRIVGEDGWTALYLGWTASSGIRNGTFMRWPGMDNRPSASSTPASMVANIELDVYSECIIAPDGTTSCDPTSSVWADVDVGSTYQCALKPDRTIWCWGANRSNALGQGVLPEDMKVMNPTQVGADADWQEVTAGHSQTCALKTNGTLWCWGGADYTGTAGVDTLGVPTQIGTDSDWIRVDAHWGRTCAEKVDGRVFCWGRDDSEIVPGMASAPSPVLLDAGPFERWLLGGHVFCGRTAGRWSCFGRNEWGQLGVDIAGPVTGFVDLCGP